MKTLLPKLKTGNLLSLAFLVGAILFAGFTANAQTTTFAQTIQLGGAQDFVFSNNGASGTFNTVPGGSQVLFTYFNIPGLDSSLTTLQPATVTVTSSTTAPATTSGTEATQPINNTFTISIIRNTPAAPGVGTGSRTNLLTAVIQPAAAIPGVKGGLGGGSATFNVSTPSHVVTFSSDFISFGLTTSRNMSMPFSSVNPDISIETVFGLLNSFTAAGTATFASNPAPIPQIPTAAGVAVNGRVLRADGRPIRGARVTLTEDDGTVHTTSTSTFGYFNFEGIRSGQTVLVEPISKRFRFTSRVVSLTDNVTDLDIIANN